MKVINSELNSEERASPGAIYIDGVMVPFQWCNGRVPDLNFISNFLIGFTVQ